jgi:PEP-CTERM motif
MNKRVAILTVLGCALVLMGVAGADVIPYSYSGPGLVVSGTMFGSDNGDGSWTINDIWGYYNQSPVTGLVAVGADPHFFYNNLYYYDAKSSPEAVDYFGIVFTVKGVGDVNLCSYTTAGGCGSGGYASILWDGGGYEFTQVSKADFGSPVPEPSTLALMGGALLAAGMFARRHLWG